MQKAKTITLSYQRHEALVDDEHLFSGKVCAALEDGTNDLHEFSNARYHEAMTAVSRYLRIYPDAPVSFVRTEKAGLQPIKLEEDMRVMLRDDPVRAIDAMTVKTGSKVQVSNNPEPVIKSGYDTLADSFGEKLYLRMKNGAVEDPTTGRWGSLALVVKTGQWALRGPENKHLGWLTLELPEIAGESIDPESEETGALLASCRWASVTVEELLRQPHGKFFLPRRWNHSQWITRQALIERHEEFLQKRKEIES